MSVYEFEHAGQRIEREYPLGKAPQSVRVGGKRYRRVISAPTVHFGGHVNGRDVHFVATSLDPALGRFHKGEFVSDHGQKIPAFSGKQQIRDFERRAADAGVDVKYNDGSVPVRRPPRR